MDVYGQLSTIEANMKEVCCRDDEDGKVGQNSSVSVPKISNLGSPGSQSLHCDSTFGSFAFSSLLPCLLS